MIHKPSHYKDYRKCYSFIDVSFFFEVAFFKFLFPFLQPRFHFTVFCLVLLHRASVFQFIALVIDFNLYLFFISRLFILFVPTDSQARMAIVIQ